MNKSIRNIERNLSLKRIKNQKKYSAQILCISIITVLLIQLSFQITAGMQKTFLDKRLDIYGAWDRILLHLTPQDETLINNNPFINQKGKIEIYGVLDGDYTENKQSNIGTVDEEAWKLGRLKLKEGQLPRNADEIAMEYSMIAALGYEDKLGDKIVLHIIPSLEFSDRPMPIRLEFTLTGIIKDYQVNWGVSMNNRLPAGIVTAEGASRIGGILEQHMLIKAKENYVSVYDDLEKSNELQCGIVENVNQTQIDSSYIPFYQFLDNIRILISGAAMGILIITITYSIHERKNFWHFLRALGSEKKQIYKILFWEAVTYCTVSVIIGTVLGIVIYKCIVPILCSLTQLDMTTNISGSMALKSVFYCIIVIIFSYFFSCMKLNKVIEGGTKEKSYTKKKRRQYSIRKFNSFSYVTHQWRNHLFRKAVQIFLFAGIVIISGIGFLELRKQEENLAIFKISTGNGYYLDTQSSVDSPGISEKMAQKFAQIAGVESVEAYNSNAPREVFTVDLSAYSDSTYFHEIINTMKMYGLEIPLDKMELSVFGINHLKDLERFTANLDDSDEMDYEKFMKGESCILFLPPLEKRYEEGIGEISLGNCVDELYKKSFLSEEKVKAGDELLISHIKPNGETENQSIKIGGILRTLKEKDCKTPLPGGSTVSILVGTGFWNKFQTVQNQNYYQMLRINLTEEADVLDTEQHIIRNLRVMQNVQFENWHEEYKIKRSNLYTFIASYSVFVAFYILFIFIVLYQMFEVEREIRKRETNILKSLGMEDSFLKKAGRIEILLMTLAALVVSAIVLAGYYAFWFVSW